MIISITTIHFKQAHPELLHHPRQIAVKSRYYVEPPEDSNPYSYILPPCTGSKFLGSGSSSQKLECQSGRNSKTHAPHPTQQQTGSPYSRRSNPATKYIIWSSWADPCMHVEDEHFVHIDRMLYWLSQSSHVWVTIVSNFLQFKWQFRWY